VAGDFERPDEILESVLEGDDTQRTLVLFLGSTIGNLEPSASVEMLRRLYRVLRPGDGLLLGTDLDKDESILIPAYDDSLRVTAAFNLNLLVRMNRDFGATFALNDYRHMVRYDRQARRIEMHLVSQTDHRVRLEGLQASIDFGAGETIHTESSYKFDADSVVSLARDAGFEVQHRWCDARGYFAESLLRRT
jgi:uncharacterized SAM-dependent methyltransferase